MQVRSEPRSRWAIPVWLSLLAVSILINYVDRGNLAVAGPLLKDELHISNTQIGVLITAFFWTYTVVLAFSGWIVDRFDVNWILAGGFVLWSTSHCADRPCSHVRVAAVARMLLGIGESVAFPSYGKIIALNVPQQHRGTANAMITSGMSLGPAIGHFRSVASRWSTMAGVRSLLPSGWSACFGFCPGFITSRRTRLTAFASAPRCPWWRSCGRTELLGRVVGPLLQQLSLLLHGRVAADVPGTRTSPHHAANGQAKPRSTTLRSP